MKLYPSVSKEELERSDKAFQAWLNETPSWKARDLDLLVRNRSLDKITGYYGVIFYKKHSHSGIIVDISIDSDTACASILWPWTKIRIKRALKNMTDEDRETFLEWFDLCERVKGYDFKHCHTYWDGNKNNYYLYNDGTPSEAIKILTGFYEASKIVRHSENENHNKERKKTKIKAREDENTRYREASKTGSRFLNQLKGLLRTGGPGAKM